MTHRGTAGVGTDVARRRAEEDAAALIAVLAVVSASSEVDAAPGPATVWADPAQRFRVRRPGEGAWWASGLPA